MVHGDVDSGNILQSGTCLVAVDPKAMIGDPASDLWPPVSQLGAPTAGPDPRKRDPSPAAPDADLLRAWSGVLAGIRMRQGI